MGQRGPAPLPTNVKALRGNPGKRPLTAGEPKPAQKAPPCPAWLHPDAKREWRRVVPELQRLGLLTVVDRSALAAYCQSYARWQQAEQFLSKNGLSVPLTRTDRDGNEAIYAIQQRPEVAISQRERQLMRAFLSDFGLSPSSRSRLSLPELEQKDEFEEFLTRRG